MTKDNAIFTLEYYKLTFASNEKAIEAFDMAISALECEPCEKAISKQAVLDVLAKYDNDMKSDVYNEIFDSIDKLPYVNPDKTGHWIDDGQYAEGHSQHVYRCSECNKIYIGYIGKYKECPNCKAKMYELTGSED